MLFKAAQPSPSKGLVFLFPVKYCNSRHVSVHHSLIPLIRVQVRMGQLLFSELKLGLVFVHVHPHFTIISNSVQHVY